MEFKGQDSNAYPNIAKGQLDKESIEDISESAEYKSGNNVSMFEKLYIKLTNLTIHSNIPNL